VNASAPILHFSWSVAFNKAYKRLLASCFPCMASMLSHSYSHFLRDLLYAQACSRRGRKHLIPAKLLLKITGFQILLISIISCQKTHQKKKKKAKTISAKCNKIPSRTMEFLNSEFIQAPTALLLFIYLPVPWSARLHLLCIHSG